MTWRIVVTTCPRPRGLEIKIGEALDARRARDLAARGASSA